ncbi:MAG TPA: Na+/H+ antiporter [Steroidobacteraceae bacterium]|jgi:Na+/H+ antiporter|nr:Na+/H+ antiporter [Steroidobacteraceae bacterium]
MIETIQLLVALLIVVAGIAVLSTRLAIPSAILLVIAGDILALIPGLPTITLAPEFVLLMVLPPLIYSAAVAMSWREFKFNLRPITLLAVGCVVFTAVAAAAATHWLLGFPWEVGFVLGAIVSPPDAVAPLSIARRMQIPHRILVVLEGEGLANDATALILYRFAIGAVSVGAFSLGKAAATFSIIVVGELVWGLAVGWLMLRLRRWARDPRVEITLSLLTPYLAYWPPEYLGGSGVLATVTAGLYISWNGLRLISAATRLQGIFFWDLLTYLTEGLVFLITGLQARTLLSRIQMFTGRELVVSALVVCVVVILARFVWIYPATYLPRRLSAALARRDPSPPWQYPFALSFTGVRGIVSLAAALAIPLTTATGDPFPYRDLILFLTFAVILVTLVGQGLMLPAVIRWLGLANAGALERADDRVEELTARRLAIEAAIQRLDALGAESTYTDEFLEPVRSRYRERLRHVAHSNSKDEDHRRLSKAHDDIELELIETERQALNDLYRDGAVKDEARRRIERALDLREAHLRSLRGDPD